MKNLFLCFLILCSIQLPLSVSASVPLKKWNGIWRGTCQQSNRQGPLAAFGMMLEVVPLQDGILKWEITYQNQATRAYRLKSQNNDRFLLDEQNGIVLVQRYFRAQGAMHSLFSVSGNLIAVKEELIDSPNGASINISMTTYRLDMPLETRSHQGDGVTSYEPIHLQSCLLKK